MYKRNLPNDTEVYTVLCLRVDGSQGESGTLTDAGTFKSGFGYEMEIRARVPRSTDVHSDRNQKSL